MMMDTYLPETKIRLTFLDVPAHKPNTPKAYPPLYYGSTGGSGPLASVNAGNSEDLYVGGDGVNGGFKKALQAQKCDLYQARHQELFNKQTAAGAAAFETYSDEDPMKFSFV